MSGSFSLTLTQRDDYQFDVAFDHDAWPTVLLDEPEPLGGGAGPNASRMLGAAIGNCLGASLLFCLQKARVEVTGLEVKVTGTMERNERGRLRIGGVDVTVMPTIVNIPEGRYARCLEVFEDFCVVTASVRNGITVNVTVEPTEEPGTSGEDPADEGS